MNKKYMMIAIVLIAVGCIIWYLTSYIPELSKDQKWIKGTIVLISQIAFIMGGIVFAVYAWADDDIEKEESNGRNKTMSKETK